MTDLEISKALALAIGWPTEAFCLDPTEKTLWLCLHFYKATEQATWRVFDYRDPTIIWLIAERFDCFPFKSIKDDDEVWCAEGQFARFYESCSKKAVAMAVIGGAG